MKQKGGIFVPNRFSFIIWSYSEAKNFTNFIDFIPNLLNEVIDVIYNGIQKVSTPQSSCFFVVFFVFVFVLF